MKKNFEDFENLSEIEFCSRNSLRNLADFQNFKHFYKKFAPDLFSRFDVYWIQTNKQTPKLNLYIDKGVEGVGSTLY